jgi:hypothetical protein
MPHILTLLLVHTTASDQISNATTPGDLGLLLFRAGTYQTRLDHNDCPTASSAFIAAKKENKTEFFAFDLTKKGKIDK